MDWSARGLLAAIALYILFSFNDTLSTAMSFVVLAAIGYWLVYRRKHESGETEVVELDAKALGTVPGGSDALGTMS